MGQPNLGIWVRYDLAPTIMASDHAKSGPVLRTFASNKQSSRARWLTQSARPMRGRLYPLVPSWQRFAQDRESLRA